MLLYHLVALSQGVYPRHVSNCVFPKCITMIMSSPGRSPASEDSILHKVLSDWQLRMEASGLRPPEDSSSGPLSLVPYGARSTRVSLLVHRLSRDI